MANQPRPGIKRRTHLNMLVVFLILLMHYQIAFNKLHSKCVTLVRYRNSVYLGEYYLLYIICACKYANKIVAQDVLHYHIASFIVCISITYLWLVVTVRVQHFLFQYDGRNCIQIQHKFVMTALSSLMLHLIKFMSHIYTCASDIPVTLFLCLQGDAS